MSTTSFREEIWGLIKRNPDGEPTEGPFIYSIRVTRPRGWAVDATRFKEKKVRESPVPEGSLYHGLLYELDHSVLERVLVQFMGADEVEVRYTLTPGSPSKEQRVQLTS